MNKYAYSVDVCVADEDIVLAPTKVPAAAEDDTAKAVIDAESSSTLLTLLIGFSDKALKPSIIYVANFITDMAE